MPESWSVDLDKKLWLCAKGCCMVGFEETMHRRILGSDCTVNVW